jgi:hypothetical protein
MGRVKRAFRRADQLLKQLNSPTPARLHPRPNRTMERRDKLEATLLKHMAVVNKSRKITLNKLNKLKQDVKRAVEQG